MIGMPRLRFTLRQLLLAVAVAAVVLLLIRYAMRSDGAAAGVLTLAIGAGVFLAANLLTYSLLRAVSQLFGPESDGADAVPSPDSAAPATIPAPLAARAEEQG